MLFVFHFSMFNVYRQTDKVFNKIDCNAFTLHVQNKLIEHQILPWFINPKMMVIMIIRIIMEGNGGAFLQFSVQTLFYIAISM